MKILGSGPSLNIIFICLADPLQEMDGVGVAQVPLKHLEYVSLHQEDFIFGMWHVVKEVHDGGWCTDLLNFRGDEKVCNTKQWEFS